MRENKYVTMMDPFQKKYGHVISTALIFPALVADVLWVARTLVSLGKLLHPVTLSGAKNMCALALMQSHQHLYIRDSNVHERLEQKNRF